MEKLRIRILMALLVVTLLLSPIRAQIATKNEAMTVAGNWVNLIIHLKGDWGGSKTAEVENIQEFKRGERLLGYFCHVKPKGHIVVSLRKELAPVKAYSATCDLHPGSDEGMVDLIKGCMERILKGIEEQVGPIRTAKTQDVANILDINYRPAWEELEVDSKIFKEKSESGGLRMDYQEGNILLSSSWHQKPPYNDDCPDEGCEWYPCYSNENTPVGCPATAQSQIMRHWNWPPYGVSSPYDDDYDWPNMPDSFSGCDWVQAQVDAVAELCRESGMAMNQFYECNGSGLEYEQLGNIETSFEDKFRYDDDCERKDRYQYTATGWFNIMKGQFNKNRPIFYLIPGHAIVSDGWREIGGGPTRQYHMNYGWTNTNYNTWYTLDALYYPIYDPGKPDNEIMFIEIYPAQALGNSLSGTYALNESFPYRYFDRDATGTSATFNSGQYLQFLPGITVTCTGTGENSICFDGSSSNNTVLFSRGDTTKGILIKNGSIKLYPNGSLVID